MNVQRLFDRCYSAEVKIIWEFSGSITRDLAELYCEFRSVAGELNLRAPTPDRDFVESTLWPCPKSDWTEMCVYDHDNDPTHDTCVFCGDPEERK